MTNEENQEIDRYVHEAMGKKNCFHKIGDEAQAWMQCIDCGRAISTCLHIEDGLEWITIDQNPTYLRHNEHWGEMLNWAMKESWWGNFSTWLFNKKEKDYNGYEYEGLIHLDYIASPPALATKLTEYLKGRE